MSKRIDLKAVAAITGSRYPAPFDAPCAARVRQRLGDAAGLTDFGVNLLRLPPGVLVQPTALAYRSRTNSCSCSRARWYWSTNAGEEILRPGDSAGFKAGTEDGHHLQNRSQRRRRASGSRIPQTDRGRGGLSGYRLACAEGTRGLHAQGRQPLPRAVDAEPVHRDPEAAVGQSRCCRRFRGNVSYRSLARGGPAIAPQRENADADPHHVEATDGHAPFQPQLMMNPIAPRYSSTGIAANALAACRRRSAVGAENEQRGAPAGKVDEGLQMQRCHFNASASSYKASESTSPQRSGPPSAKRPAPSVDQRRMAPQWPVRPEHVIIGADTIATLGPRMSFNASLSVACLIVPYREHLLGRACKC